VRRTAGEGVCNAGATQNKICGVSGRSYRTCDQCGWGNWTLCDECVPSASSIQSCGLCGTQSRTCEPTGTWSGWAGCSGEGQCANGTVDTQSCGTSGSQNRTCGGNCNWGGWNNCNECPPGKQETTSCGKCGQQSRTCQATGIWGSWGICSNEKECFPDATKNLMCGNCGNSTATCNSSCAWEISTCQNEGDCHPGFNQTATCEYNGTQSRVCSNQCGWNAWSVCQHFDSVSAPKSTSPDNINIQKEGSPTTSFPTIVIAIVAAIVALILLTLLIAAFILLRRRAKRKKQANNKKAKNVESSAGSPYSSIDSKSQESFLSENLKKILDEDWEWSIPVAEVEVSQLLGSGSFGAVYKGYWVPRSTEMAVKILRAESLSADIEVEKFKAEAKLMQKIRHHENVVQFLGVIKGNGIIALGMEFLGGGSLYQYLRKGSVSTELMIKFAMDIAKGMRHLHLENVIHRDLATRNLLLDSAMNVKGISISIIFSSFKFKILTQLLTLECPVF
jgi:hypothetical protein